MHTLKPNTRYRILTAKFAVPEDVGDAEFCDALNETLREGLDTAPWDDWTLETDISGIAGDPPPVYDTDGDPEEGEVFYQKLPLPRWLRTLMELLDTLCAERMRHRLEVRWTPTGRLRVWHYPING